MLTAPIWYAEDVVRLIQGESLFEQSWVATGVSMSRRATKRGDLFVALDVGGHDGHDDVGAAFAAGASAAIVSRQPACAPADAPLVFVENVALALEDMARIGRQRSQAKLIAVTGSTGKTSTKEMIRLALGAVGKAFANTDEPCGVYGLSLAMAALPPMADYAVVELDMADAVCPYIAAPDVAVITTVEQEHIGLSASLEVSAEAKANIFRGMGSSGTAILNKDSLFYGRLANAAKGNGIKKVLGFSQEKSADAQLLDCGLSHKDSLVKVLIMGRALRYSIGSPGHYFVANSLAALLAAHAASGKMEECAAALALYQAPVTSADVEFAVQETLKTA